MSLSTNATISSERAKACLTFENRAETPPDVRKFRRSKNLEPGRRYIHPGIADDLEKMDLSSKIFGNKSDPIRYTAANLMNNQPLNVVDRLNITKAEKTYYTLKREPLGQTYKRDYVMPKKFTDGNEAFGRSSRLSAEPAKNIIFPQMDESTFAGEDLYKRTHGSYGVGEQKRRGYNWNINPDTVRFGIRADTIAFNGVSKNIADVLAYPEDSSKLIGTKTVEELRGMGDVLGHARDLGMGSKQRTEQFVYGLPSSHNRRSKNTQWSAAETIRGKYSAEDQMPDTTLGKSQRPGFRNTTTDNRAFGCPTVRNDIPLPARRSVADPQNYGDEVSAKELIHPRNLAGSSVIEISELDEPKPKLKIRSIFQSIGYDLPDDAFDAIFHAAVGHDDTAEYVSINDFRHVLNDYLEHST